MRCRGGGVGPRCRGGRGGSYFWELRETIRQRSCGILLRLYHDIMMSSHLFVGGPCFQIRLAYVLIDALMFVAPSLSVISSPKFQAADGEFRQDALHKGNGIALVKYH